MKKIDFGFDNSKHPTGGHQGLGVTGTPNGPTNGELLSLVKLKGGDVFLVTKITDAFHHDPELIGRIDVREAIADLYADGSGVLYVNQEKSPTSRDLEELLNSEKTRILIEKGMPIRDICDGYNPPFSFECVTRGETIVTTGITPEVFEHKKYLILHSHQPISEMTAMINGEYEEKVTFGGIGL